MRARAYNAAMSGVSMSKSQWGLLIALSMLWGGSFFFVGAALREAPPMFVVAARLALAAVALNIAVLVAQKRMPTQWRLWLAFAGMGLLNNAMPFSLLAWGQTQIASGLAAILNATMVMFSVLVAHFFTDNEKITPARLFGVAAGFAGVTVMIGADALSGLGGAVLAQLAVLGATFCYACSTVYGLRFRRWGIPPLIAATGQITTAALLLLPMTMWIDRPWTFIADLSPPTVWSLLGLGVASTGLAYLIYFRILAVSGATNVALVTFLVPITSIVLGAAFLNETLKAEHFAGMALIGVGLAAIDGRLQKALWKK